MEECSQFFRNSCNKVTKLCIAYSHHSLIICAYVSAYKELGHRGQVSSGETEGPGIIGLNKDLSKSVLGLKAVALTKKSVETNNLFILVC
jgi:hypothetical protein